MSRLSASNLPSSEGEGPISFVYPRGRSVVSIGETNVDVSIYVLHVILSDIPVPISGGLETGHSDGMHAILCSWFDVVKVLPLHEVERVAAVEMIRYGYPFVRVRWVFDFAKRI